VIRAQYFKHTQNYDHFSGADCSKSLQFIPFEPNFEKSKIDGFKETLYILDYKLFIDFLLKITEYIFMRRVHFTSTRLFNFLLDIHKTTTFQKFYHKI
jgi:hypothetical protein